MKWKKLLTLLGTVISISAPIAGSTAFINNANKILNTKNNTKKLKLGMNL